MKNSIKLIILLFIAVTQISCSNNNESNNSHQELNEINLNLKNAVINIETEVKCECDDETILSIDNKDAVLVVTNEDIFIYQILNDEQTELNFLFVCNPDPDILSLQPGDYKVSISGEFKEICPDITVPMWPGTNYYNINLHQLQLF